MQTATTKEARRAESAALELSSAVYALARVVAASLPGGAEAFARIEADKDDGAAWEAWLALVKTDARLSHVWDAWRAANEAGHSLSKVAR